MSNQIYRNKEYIIISASKGYIAINTNKPFKDGHTHLNNFKACQRVIHWCKNQVVPKNTTDYILASLIRISNNNSYKTKLQQLLNERGINMKNNLIYNPNAIIEVTKEFTFDSAHFLKEYIGKCANLHGHLYRLQVTIKGKCTGIGMVLDFNFLKRAVKDLVVDKLDHKMLNDILEFNTTAENMSVWMYDILSVELKRLDVELVSIKLWETPTSCAEYKGEVTE